MMRSLFSGVSGLKSHQTRMDVIGNNIANINTVGFKSSRVTFADILSQTQSGASSPSDNLGGTNPKQIGLGTAVASVDLIFNDGSPQATGKNTDVALSGNGLFVLKSGSQTYFTRDGAFEFDAAGNYVLPGSGYYVQGWNAIDGALNTNATPTNIVVPAGKTMAATATSAVNFTGNLDAGAPTVVAITYTKQDGSTQSIDTDTTTSDSGINIDGTKNIAATITLSDGTTKQVTSGYYSLRHSIPITTISTVYDSEGNTHAVTMLLDKAGENHWRVYLAPGSDTAVDSAAVLPSDITVRSTQADGSSDTVTMKVSHVYFNPDGSLKIAGEPNKTVNGLIDLKYSNGNGATDTSVTVVYNGLTQYAGSSTVYPTADGNAYGVLQSVSIDTAGIITGTYTNGQRRFEAQIAVAQFINASGLTKVGTSLYLESNNSGAANIKTVTNLGLSITPSALEMSNVDLSNELSDMIITQRGFQSNSKIITVADEMLETIINMKR